MREPGARAGGPPSARVVLVWTWVLVPFGCGRYRLVVKIPALVGG